MKYFLTLLTVADLRVRLLFTVSLLVIFRLGSHITIPGIDFSVLDAYLDTQTGGTRGITDYIDLFAGGAFKRLSLFALGIMPYISASIILQLLMIAVPSLQRLQKEGEQGRKKVAQYTKYGTVFLCAIQSYGITVYIRSLHNTILNTSSQELIISNSSVLFIIFSILSITTGTMVLVWLGEVITEKGFGNGISLLVFTGIVSVAPSSIYSFWSDVQRNEQEVVLALVLMIVFVIMISLSILLTEGVRKIPVRYGKRVIGKKMMQGASQTLPIKANASNVMPIIFASSLMLFPSQLSTVFADKYPEVVSVIQTYLSPNSLVYMFCYIILIIFFAYFYTSLQYNPKDIAEALKKNGGYIPSIRPGVQTEDYLKRVLNRITLSGAIFLAFIAITPDILIRIWDLYKYQNLASLFGGTSLLIIVGVALDTLKQIDSQMIMRQYDTLMDGNKTSSKGRKYKI